MTLNLSNYSSVYYRSQIESKRIELIKELIYSDSADRLDILKRLHPEESNLELKFEIRRAIDDLESVKSNSFSTENDYDDKLRQTLRYGDISVRHKTLSAIVSNRRSDLLHMLRELSPLVRDPYMEAAILKLLALNPVKNLKEICSYLKSSDDRVIASAIQIVGNINNTQSLALIANYLTHQNNRVRSNAAIAFEKSDPELAKKHVLSMAQNQALNCLSGKQIPCEIDSVCIHGDNESSLSTAKSIKENLIENGLELKPLNKMEKFI